jgi:cytochrome b561
MPARNTTARWGSVAQTFHWVIVALVVTQFVLINLAHELPLGGEKIARIGQHKSVGITVLLLAALRLLWRALNPTPALPGTLKAYERFLARFTHYALYALLFSLPLTGWAMSSARNFPVSWFGHAQLPDLVAPNRPLYETLHGAHELLAGALFLVALLHVLAALKHHFFLKDDVLRRMLPFTRTPK